jgi:hypothetical protein
MLLLMLIEALVAAGATIINANTDGLVIISPQGSSDAVAAAVTNWQQRTGLTLERNDLQSYATTANGSFIVVDTDGKTKVRGAFSYDRNGKTGAEIIPMAVEACLTQNVQVDEFIANHTVATDFLYYRRMKPPWSFYAGSTLLPSTLRWYASGPGGLHLTERHAGKPLTQAVPHGLNVRLALTLPSNNAADLVGLDRTPYIDAANALIAKVMGNR